jgi:hypothetical protein
MTNRALVPMLNLPENSPEFLIERARAQVRDRDHFCLSSGILKSVGNVVESHEPKVICLLFFIREAA